MMKTVIKKSHSFLMPGLLALALLGGCQQAQDPQAESARLTEWLDEQYAEELQFSPFMLTFYGSKDRYHEMDDLSEAEEARKLAWKAQSVAELKKKFDYQALTEDGKDSYDIWVYQYEQARAQEPFKRHGYLFEHLNGPQNSLPSFLMSFHKVEEEDDMRAYIARISGGARALEQLLERADLNAEAGVRPPRFAYEGVIEQSTALITGAPFDQSESDAPLWADAKTKIQALLDGEKIDEQQAEKLRAKARTALVEDFGPTYRKMIAWAEKEMQQVPAQAAGVGSLPNGEAYYNTLLANTTTTELTADEIHNIGLAEVARIRAEMEALVRQVEFEGSLQEFFEFVRSDRQFYYPNTDEGRQAFIDDSMAFLDNIKGELPEYFGILPKADLVMKRVESFREQAGAPAHYYPGTPDGSRPGIYYAHLLDMDANSKTDMETTAYHEGNPGHHMQISIAQELEGIPVFRTRAFFTVYSEGWALYAEKLAREMGAFEDPYKLFGHLTADMWRAIRLVVDTGLHAKGWSEEQAVQYFLENSAIPEASVRAEVRRYLVWPSQATAYMIGKLKILELREQAQSELGDKFDIRGFHDTVLGGGAVPMPVLEKRVARWVEETRRG